MTPLVAGQGSQSFEPLVPQDQHKMRDHMESLASMPAFEQTQASMKRNTTAVTAQLRRRLWSQL